MHAPDANAGPARRAGMILLILAIVLFDGLTQRPGYSWYWDDPGYVLHARNLAEGRPYADTGYIPNPHNYIAPQAYPPGLPLLLHTVVAMFGVDPTALRVLNLLIHFLMLAVLARLIRDDLPLPHRCVLVGAVGLHPMFWDYLHRMMSDLPFVLLVFAALLFYRRAGEDGLPSRSRLLFAIAAGAAAWFAIITRSLGVTLPASFLLYDLISRRRPSRAFVVAAATSVLLFAGQESVSRVYAAMTEARPTPADSAEQLTISTEAPAPGPEAGEAPAVEQQVSQKHGYAYLALYNILGSAERVPGRVLRNARKYVVYMDHLLGNLHSERVQHILFVLFVPPFFLGFVVRVRKRFSAVEVFAVVYFLAILPWSWGGPRLLFPLLPLYFLYVLEGLRRFERRLGAGAPVMAVAAAVAIGGTYAAKFTVTDRSAFRDPWTGAGAQRLYGFLQENSARDDVMIGHFPRQLALFGERSFSAPCRPRTPDEIWWRYMDRIGVRYIVVGPFLPPPQRPMDLIGELDRFVHRWPERTEKAFESSEFHVYRVLSPESAPPPES